MGEVDECVGQNNDGSRFRRNDKEVQEVARRGMCVLRGGEVEFECLNTRNDG